MLCSSVFVRPPILWLRVGFCTLCVAKVRFFFEMNKLFKSFFPFTKEKGVSIVLTPHFSLRFRMGLNSKNGTFILREVRNGVDWRGKAI